MNKKGGVIRLANTNLCTGCHACSNICPSSSIVMTYNKYGFLQPSIKSKSCIKCHLCETSCPVLSNRKNENDNILSVYAAIINDEKIRFDSSSGGAFWAFASFVIRKGGVVFGAKFCNNKVIHGSTEYLDGLQDFMGSKYIQSDVGSSYKDVKQFLEKGRMVLFTGTPCQIAGLKQYLRRDDSNLYTIEILCRGVPSPKVWDAYINKKAKELQAKEIKDIRFRTKSPKYSSPIYSYVFRFNYLNEANKWAEYWENCNNNPFFSYFLHHIFRSSCYDCKFRNSYSSGTDLTIGDSISVSSLENGGEKVSTIVVHSNKGRFLFESIKSSITYEEQDSSIIDGFYKSAMRIARWDKKFRPWRLSNYLALHFPLERIRSVFEYTPFFIKMAVFIKQKLRLSK